MGFRYVPEDMIRHSDFRSLFEALPPEDQASVRDLMEGFIRENPSNRLSPLTGPGYFMMHWLMADLYASLAIFLVRKRKGDPEPEILADFDRCLTKKGRAMNRKMKGVMKIPGAFQAARLIAPKAMTLANGHGFQVSPVPCGKDEFGFNVMQCPYRSLFAKYQAEALGPVFCRFDDTMGSGFDNLEFIRKGTLCRGNSQCDFRYKRK